MKLLQIKSTFRRDTILHIIFILFEINVLGSRKQIILELRHKSKKCLNNLYDNCTGDSQRIYMWTVYINANP